MAFIKKLFKRDGKAAKSTKASKPKSSASTVKTSSRPAAKPAPKATHKKAATEYQPQCAALTAGGKQCKNSARAGSKYCGSHKGYQPPARGKARAKTNTKPRVAKAADTAASGRRSAGKKQCAATTAAGTRCKRDAVPRGKYCPSHKTT